MPQHRKIRDGASIKMTSARCSCGRKIPVRLAILGSCCLNCAKGKGHHHSACDERNHR